MTSLISFLFRKKSLQSIFFIIVIAIIREAAAIGADQGYEALVNEVVSYYNTKSAIIGGLLILLIYTKGSYITLVILFALLYVVYSLLRVEITAHKIAFPYLDLYVENVFRRPQQINQGISPKGYGKTFSPGDAPYKFLYKWLFKIRIVNVSDHNAYNVTYEVENNKELFDYMPPFSKPLSVTSNTKVEVEGYAELKKEISGKEGTKYRESELPEDKDFHDYKILVSYNNSDQVKFYTLFTCKDGQTNNSYFRYIPEPFAKYNWIQKLRIRFDK
jgi:hypothetical protein